MRLSLSLTPTELDNRFKHSTFNHIIPGVTTYLWEFLVVYCHWEIMLMAPCCLFLARVYGLRCM